MCIAGTGRVEGGREEWKRQTFMNKSTLTFDHTIFCVLIFYRSLHSHFKCSIIQVMSWSMSFVLHDTIAFFYCERRIALYKWSSISQSMQMSMHLFISLTAYLWINLTCLSLFGNASFGYTTQGGPFNFKSCAFYIFKLTKVSSIKIQHCQLPEFLW